MKNHKDAQGPLRVARFGDRPSLKPSTPTPRAKMPTAICTRVHSRCRSGCAKSMPLEAKCRGSLAINPRQKWQTRRISLLAPYDQLMRSWCSSAAPSKLVRRNKHVQPCCVVLSSRTSREERSYKLEHYVQILGERLEQLFYSVSDPKNS